MTSEITFGREPIQIVSLLQPRCSRRFGTAPCVATTADGARCYQTWTSCLDRANILYTGSIEWMFAKPDVMAGEIIRPEGEVTLETEIPAPLLAEDGSPLEGGWLASSAPLLTYQRSGEAIRTNLIPCLVAVSQSASKLNVGAARDGESPFGVRSAVTVRFQDIPWDDHVGDFYLAQRAGVRGQFWQKWVARNMFYSNMVLRVYEGYRGQRLEEMQQRLYIVDKADGPDADGSVTLSGIDPLRLADGRRAKFPRVTPLKLSAAITNVATTGIALLGAAPDLTDTFGNTAGTRYVRIGSEILSYTGQVEAPAGTFTLSGVARGQLGTTAASASVDAAAQRCGRYSLINAWDALYDLLTVHTDIPAQYIDKTQWDVEAALYLNGFDVTATVHEPVSVETLAGELMQQTSMYVWWDERRQTIPLKAVRPEPSSAILSDNANILSGSAELMRDAEAWFTQLFVYYDQRDPTKGFVPTNFDRLRGRVDGEAELPEAGNTVRQKVIFSRWLRSEAQAVELTVRLLGRYRRVPRYLSVTLDAKDRSILVGDIVTVNTRTVADTEGNTKGERWQVIRADEIEPGHAIRYDLQEFQFGADRYGKYMAAVSPDFDVATDAEKEAGGWWSDSTGKMPDSSAGYAWQ